MTFHWAANYGAVLQAYALQQYLVNTGFKTEVIDYWPYSARPTKIKWIVSKSLNSLRIKFQAQKREKAILPFREKYIKLSPHRYGSKDELLENPPEYDVYISGSDQIWNPNFTAEGDHGLTLSYFLDFAPHGKKRISYSSSFGVPQIPKYLQDPIKDQLLKFSFLSVRETCGINILKELGLTGKLTVDPTLLLNRIDYENMTKNINPSKEQYIFDFTLHNEENITKNVTNKAKQILNTDLLRRRKEMSVEQWIAAIQHSQLVVTNSFHCVVFCLIFHVPFISIKVRKLDMSDRLVTLLNSVSLENRFINGNEAIEKIEELINHKIDWTNVDNRLELLRTESRKFLLSSIGI